MIRFQSLLFILSLLTLLTACGGGSTPPESPPGEPGQLVSVTRLDSNMDYSPGTIRQMITDNFLLGLLSGQVDNVGFNVTVHRVVYWTSDATDTPVKASGLLIYPDTQSGNTPPILSYQHGTIFGNNRAPTIQGLYKYIGIAIAAMDNIVVIPDYVGYGESVGRMHPYMHAGRLAASVVDLLRAVRTYIGNESIPTDGQLFLAGFSEGAYAAVATHKMIQEQLSTEFSVTGTMAGPGAYDLSSTTRDFLAGDTLPSGATAAFLYKAYDVIYGYNRINAVLRQPYSDNTGIYFNGAYDDVDVAGAFTDTTNDLYQPSFLASFRGDGETILKQHIVENNVYDWAPTSPIRFFHGVDDLTTPYVNSQTAVDAMKENDPEAMVELIDCASTDEGFVADHNNCFGPYIEDMVAYLLANK